MNINCRALERAEAACPRHSPGAGHMVEEATQPNLANVLMSSTWNLELAAEFF